MLLSIHEMLLSILVKKIDKFFVTVFAKKILHHVYHKLNMPKLIWLGLKRLETIWENY